MNVLSLTLTVGLGIGMLLAQATPPVLACPRCGWKPPVAVRTITVSNVGELERAADAARPGDTVLMTDGDYPLKRMIDIHAANVTLRSRSGDPARVVLHGRGMTGDNVGVALSISAPGVTIADVSIRDVGYHAVQVRGEAGASGFTLHNARLQDTGQQLLKGSLSNNPVYADHGIVACSEFSYTTHAPSSYTNGVDLIGAKDWLIRDNRFTRIRGPQAGRWSAGPTILAWGGSGGTVVQRNVIVDSFRGIALGLMANLASSRRDLGRDLDHDGGVVQNNVVVNLAEWADEGIEVNAARDVRVDHNTVLVEGSLAWSISIRFPISSARVTNNLTNRQVLMRDGGRAVLEGNVSGAAQRWFVDAPKADLRLSAEGASRSPNAGVIEWRPPGR